jgi:MFS transporter, OFA family, oxalate/formate antiporter
MTMKFFYGWLLLAGLFVMYLVTNGVVLNTLPIFYPELIKEFGWTQAQVTKPAQGLFLLVALVSPFAGTLLDRFSARALMAAGGVLLTAAFIWYSRMHSLPELQYIYVLFAAGITLAGILPSMRIVTHWFERQRGLAIGILLVGSSLGGAVFNQVAGSYIATYGWRTAILILGGISALLIFMPLWLLVRDTPRSMGLWPDGDAAPAVKTGTAAAQVAGSTSDFAAAVRSPTFYLLLLITGAMWFCIVGVIQHQTLFFKDLATAIPAKNVLSVFFVSSIAGKVVFGWLGDRFSKKHIMLASVICLGLGTLLLNMVPQNPAVLLWAYALVFGIGFSGTFTMIQLLVADYYAGASYGKILGLVTMIDTAAGVAGILTLGKMRTAMGSYAGAFQILTGLCIAAAVAVLLLPGRRRPVAQ